MKEARVFVFRDPALRVQAIGLRELLWRLRKRVTETNEISWAPHVSYPHILQREPLSQKPAFAPHPIARPPTPTRFSAETEEDGSLAGGFTLSKPSLMLIAFALMMLGICFFAAGFGTGWWTAQRQQKSLSEPIKQIHGQAFDPAQMNALLEVVGAVGGNTGRIAYAAQRALDAQQPQNPVQSNAPSTQTGVSSLSSIGKNLETNRTAPSLKETEGSYFVQLGAFVAENNAVELIQSLNSQSIPAFLVPKKKEDGTVMFCVRTGEYRLFNLAQKAAETLSDQFGLSATVVEEKNP